MNLDRLAIPVGIVGIFVFFFLFGVLIKFALCAASMGNMDAPPATEQTICIDSLSSDNASKVIQPKQEKPNDK